MKDGKCVDGELSSEDGEVSRGCDRWQLARLRVAGSDARCGASLSAVLLVE